MPAVHTTTALHRRLADALAEARARTFALVSALSDDDLRRQHDPLMSPILWDLGHIAHFEELWLTRNLDGPIAFVEMPGMFNPMEHPRRTRASLPLPGLEECRALMEEIRRRVLRRLETVDFAQGPALARDGFVYRLVLQHEYQHNETILQTLQLKTGQPYVPADRREPPTPAAIFPTGRMVRFPGGDVTVGTDDRSAAYDNERPRHALTVRPFRIDEAPVSNGEFCQFIESGGYRTASLWSESGLAWLQEARVEAPKYWYRRDGTWWTRMMDRDLPVPTDHPVCHVSYYEAEAYARWVGKRLPTEIEWEVAAAWDGARGRASRFPWGDTPPTRAHANLDQLTFGTAPLGAFPDNRSSVGCYGMIGDVWEWTASEFRGYPDFVAYPYPEYSEVYFGSEYKVLRGGSWATRRGAIRTTFRNWDFPIRRQIFSGFRCAADD